MMLCSTVVTHISTGLFVTPVIPSLVFYTSVWHKFQTITPSSVLSDRHLFKDKEAQDYQLSSQIFVRIQYSSAIADVKTVNFHDKTGL